MLKHGHAQFLQASFVKKFLTVGGGGDIPTCKHEFKEEIKTKQLSVKFPF